MMRPEAGDPDPSTGAINYVAPEWMKSRAVSATTHRFHSTHPRSPTHSQSLGSEHLDPIALTVAAATMMHSDVLGGRRSPTTSHAFRSGRRPSHGHRLRILSKFTMYIDNEIEISDMQK